MLQMMRILTTSTPYKANALPCSVYELDVCVCVHRSKHVSESLCELVVYVYASKRVHSAAAAKAYLSFEVARKQVCWFRFVFARFCQSYYIRFSRSLCVYHIMRYSCYYIAMPCNAIVVCCTNTLRATSLLLGPFFYMECLNKHTRVMTTTASRFEFHRISHTNNRERQIGKKETSPSEPTNFVNIFVVWSDWERIISVMCVYECAHARACWAHNQHDKRNGKRIAREIAFRWCWRRRKKRRRIKKQKIQKTSRKSDESKDVMWKTKRENTTTTKKNWSLNLVPLCAC